MGRKKKRKTEVIKFKNKSVRISKTKAEQIKNLRRQNSERINEIIRRIIRNEKAKKK